MKPILEQIYLGEKQSILAFCYSHDHFNTPWHFHPEHELTYIQQSVGTKFIGDYVGSYAPGELVLLRSNLPHCWKNQTAHNMRAESIVIQWSKGIFAEVPELAPVFEMLQAASKGILFSEVAVSAHIHGIATLPTLRGHALYLELLSLLVKLAGCPYHTLSTASFKSDLPEAYRKRIARVHDFVSENYSRKIYLSELAELVGMSEQSFSRFFSKMMGRSFFVYLNEYRINRASRLLIDTDWSIAQVGYACGYESLPFFHKQYNKFKGESPLKFRKRYSRM